VLRPNGRSRKTPAVGIAHQQVPAEAAMNVGIELSRRDECSSV
jgi:hypothetical protein